MLDTINVIIGLFKWGYHLANLITSTTIKFLVYYQFSDQLKHEIRQNLKYDIKNDTNITILKSYY